MKKYITNIDEILSNTPEVKVYYTSVKWNSIWVYIDLIDKALREERWLLSAAKLEKKLEGQFQFLRWEGLELTLAALKWWPPTGSAVWVKLSSARVQDFDLLKIVSEDFEKYLQNIEWAKNVISSSSDTPGQFVFSFNKEKLSNIWLVSSDILNELYFYTNWIKAWSIKSNNEDNEIIISFKEFEDFLNPEDIWNLIVQTKVWKIRVWDFASYEFKKSVNNISREDWNIVISIWSEVEEWFLPTDIQPLLDDYAFNYNFPEGISYIKWGETVENSDLIISTVKSLIIALFLIFSILVFQFNSFKQPAIVLYSIILALLWVNVWLYVTWNPYSMPFGIWFIALTWIVVNDAIILIDKINKWIKYKLEHSATAKIDYIEQLVLAWKSRLQPIIVTTLTTVFWVLPLALQDEFWAWLWFTIIFWLFVWSFMTLVIVPILYQALVLRKKD
jgi:multidrug efflux pump subunit AcrB